LKGKGKGKITKCPKKTKKGGKGKDIVPLIEKKRFGA